MYTVCSCSFSIQSQARKKSETVYCSTTAEKMKVINLDALSGRPVKISGLEGKIQILWQEKQPSYSISITCNQALSFKAHIFSSFNQYLEFQPINPAETIVVIKVHSDDLITSVY